MFSGEEPIFGVHLPVNEVHPPLIETQIGLRVGELAAGDQRRLHLADALGLLLNDALGDTPEAGIFRKAQDVVGHLDGRPGGGESSVR